jgi:hypothetical protein
MKHKGLYGQAQGNERRQDLSAFNERLEDNEIVEGQHVAVLRSRFEERNWTAFTAYANELKIKGFSQPRIDSIVARASSGLRL